MPLITLTNYPVRITLIANDTPIGEITDDWGTRDVYKVEAISGENLTNKSWTIAAEDTKGKNYSRTLAPLDSGQIGIPKGKQFESEPLTFSLTFERV